MPSAIVWSCVPDGVRIAGQHAIGDVHTAPVSNGYALSAAGDTPHCTTASARGSAHSSGEVRVQRHVGGTSPIRWACAAASVRLAASSFVRMRDTWTLAVFGDMKRISAICALV